MRSRFVVVLSLLAGISVMAQSTAPPAGPGPTDIVMRFAASDGTPLEAKLTVPAGATGPVPVLFYVHGAGPRNFDHPVPYRDADGQIRVVRYYDYYAQALAQRGIAFFRMSKRGCTLDPATGRSLVDRPVFSKATPSVLLDDYAAALEVLRRRPEVDGRRIVVGAASDGTSIAPRLVLRSPDGIAGVVLWAYMEDNTHDTIVWQNLHGAWRRIVSWFPGGADGVLTRAEHAETATRDPELGTRVPFTALDPDGDGAVTAADFMRMMQPRLDAILEAVDARNDDFVWKEVVNLTSAYLLEGWNTPPTSATLLKLNVPIRIVHGDLDANVRVEGAREAAAAFAAAKKTNLTVRIHAGYDHDLNWTPQSAFTGGGPLPFQESFDWIAALVRDRLPTGGATAAQ